MALTSFTHATSAGADSPPRLTLFFLEGEGTSSKFMETSISFTLVAGLAFAATVSTSMVSSCSGAGAMYSWRNAKLPARLRQLADRTVPWQGPRSGASPLLCAPSEFYGRCSILVATATAESWLHQGLHHSPS